MDIMIILMTRSSQFDVEVKLEILNHGRKRTSALRRVGKSEVYPRLYQKKVHERGEELCHCKYRTDKSNLTRMKRIFEGISGFGVGIPPARISIHRIFLTAISHLR